MNGDLGETLTEAVYTALVVVLLVMPVVSLYANVQMWRLWRSDTRRPRSWVLFCMAAASSSINGASLFISYLAALALWHIHIDSKTALILLASAVLAIEATPVYLWAAVQRHRRSDPAPTAVSDPEQPNVPENGG